MGEMIRIEINTEVEAYPVLSIRADDKSPSDIEVPAAMLDALAEAGAAVERAELAIMRYVAERYDYTDIREWVDAHQD